MKRILVIYTGGTICTTIKKGEMDTSSQAVKALTELYYQSASLCKNNVQLINGKEFNILSENMTVNKWNTLIEYFQELFKADNTYDGIIVAHGTDTLAYSTALFSLLLKGVKIPIIFVSSNYSILNENGTRNQKANGVENFISAVECIYNGIGAGVYATYKNTNDNTMYLHKGENLLQCAIYDDNFYSCDAIDITHIDKVIFEKSTTKNKPVINKGKIELCDCVLKINPYVGLNYNMFKLEGVRAVLHSTYHSGTACVSSENRENSILYFIEKCNKQGIPFYFSPSKESKGNTVYATVPQIEKSKQVQFLYGDTEEMVYCKLLYGYSMGLTQDEIDKLLNI